MIRHFPIRYGLSALAALVLSVTACSSDTTVTCDLSDNGDGTKTILCTDGTEVTLADGQDGEPGSSCSVADNGDGTKTISCEDGSTVTITDG